MISNYLNIALRYLRKSKLYTFVNLIGLAIGITSCLLIGVYIADELSFDKFHANADRIVRVTMDYNFGDQQNKIAQTGTKIGPQFKRTFSQVEAYVRTLKYARVVSHADKMFDEKYFLYADSAFFDMFSFPLIAGDPHTVLDAPDKMVISQSTARKYFGDQDPIGKSLKVGGTKDFIISGIAKDAPRNSQIKFDFVASFMALNAAKKENWWEANYYTYLLLNNAGQINPLQHQITDYMKSVSKNELKAEGNHYLTFHLEPLTKVHLYSDLEGLEPNSSIVYIYILAIVAVLILLIACVNYTNLSIAQSAGRSGEVGVRKVLGASKGQVFSQFISESFILTLFAVIIALGLSVLLMPYFNQLSGKDLPEAVLFRPTTIIAVLVLAIVVTFTAGAYPALVLSNSRIIKVLKSGFSFTGSSSLRKSLIVFQFVISIFLIVATIIIQQQIAYIHNKDLGFDKDHVVVLPVDNQMLAHYDDLKRAFASNSGVVSVSAAYEPLTNIQWGDGIKRGTTDNEKGITVNALPVDEDFVKTLGLKIIAGSDYSLSDVEQFDTSEGGKNLHYSFMLNEAAVKALGWKPEEAIGQTISKGYPGTVKAVVKDFHFHSFHEPITPLVIFLDKTNLYSMFVKITGNNISGTLNGLEKTWKDRISNRPFEYHFLDDDYDSLYRAEQRTAGVFTSFSTIAILLACLGLFALTAYSMVRRTKEIGIRKVLGASITDILTLISKDFLILIIIALVISSPIAFYAINKWLENFSYKIGIQWWVFALAGAATLIIAFITISLQALKTASANPVKSLRTE